MKLRFGYTLILLMGIGLIIYEWYEARIPAHFQFSELPLVVSASIAIAPLAGVVLWFWMLHDALDRKDLVHRGRWIAALVLLNWIASIVYFFMVYRKHEQVYLQSRI